MGITAILCPQCGASLQVDENSDYCSCGFCNTTVRVKDVLEIRHSMDNSKLFENAMTMGRRCFNAHDYKRAEEYYMKALEFEPNSAECLYAKAIVCIYNSGMHTLSTNEFDTFLYEAGKCWLTISDSNKREMVIRKFEKDAVDMLVYLMEKSLAFDVPTASFKECEFAVNKWLYVFSIGDKVASAMKSENKKYVYKMIVEYYHKCIIKKLSAKVNDNGTVTSRAYTIPEKLQSKMRSIRNKYATLYNASIDADVANKKDKEVEIRLMNEIAILKREKKLATKRIISPIWWWLSLLSITPIVLNLTFFVVIFFVTEFAGEGTVMGDTMTMLATFSMLALVPTIIFSIVCFFIYLTIITVVYLVKRNKLNKENPIALQMAKDNKKDLSLQLAEKEKELISVKNRIKGKKEEKLLILKM